MVERLTLAGQWPGDLTSTPTERHHSQLGRVERGGRESIDPRLGSTRTFSSTAALCLLQTLEALFQLAERTQCAIERSQLAPDRT